MSKFGKDINMRTTDIADLLKDITPEQLSALAIGLDKIEIYKKLSVGFFTSGNELKYVQEAYDTNWVAPLGPNVDEFEKNLIQRVAGLIFVSDKDRGLARKRVMARLGISG